MTKKHWIIAGAASLIALSMGKRTLASVLPAGFPGRKRMPKEYAYLVSTFAGKHRIHPAILKAIISQESNWNPRAYRAEPHLKDASRGLGQILYNTALQYGFRGQPDDLFRPEVNIDWTAYILSKLLQKYKNLSDVFAAYNAGSPRRRKNQKDYINQKYVNSVTALYRSYLA